MGSGISDHDFGCTMLLCRVTLLQLATALSSYDVSGSMEVRNALCDLSVQSGCLIDNPLQITSDRGSET